MRRILRCGADALLVECADHADAIHLWHRLVIEPPPGMREAVPGAQTVLVLGIRNPRLRDVLLTIPGLPMGEADAAAVTIPVRYDGADLATVAELTGLDTADVVARHASSSYTVAFGGFAPGFAYLTGLHPSLRVPRLDTPRTRVPAGAVAIAEEYCGVYPSVTPGGWRLLGTTAVAMFDPARQPAATLRPGMQVRFEAIA